MTSQLSALLYIVVAILAGRWLALRCFPLRRADIVLIGNAWLGLSLLLFLTPAAPLFLLLVGVLLLRMAPADPARRLMFYCGVLAAAPVSVGWRIPFPGLPYLIDFRYVELVNTLLLLPFLFGAAAAPTYGSGERRGDPALRLGLCFVLLVAVLGFRSTSFTNGLRDGVDIFLQLGIPLIAIPRALRRENAVREALFGILVVSFMLACIGALQAVKGWSIYGAVPQALISHYAKGINAFRDGAFRVEATMAPIPFGIYMAVAAGLLYYQGVETVRRFWIHIGVVLLVIGSYISTSRGAQLCLLLIFASQVFFSRGFRPLRIPSLVAGVLVIGLLQNMLLEKFVSMDEHGTFAYRIELLTNAAPSIRSHPLFGTPDFKDDPDMQKSMQGQGIIDIVNIYLKMTLAHGFVGLALFCLPLFLVVRLLMRRRRQQERGGDVAAEQGTRLILSIIIAYALSLATISDVDRLMLYYWLLLAIGSAVAMAPPAPASQQPQGQAHPLPAGPPGRPHAKERR